MKFYISLNDYEALELEGELINRELEDDRIDVEYNHIENGVYAPVEVSIKEYKERWEVDKKDGSTEIVECIVRYENESFHDRFSDTIMNKFLETLDLSKYGEVKEKCFIDLLSAQEIARKYGIADSTVRKAIMEGRLKEGIDCKKYGKGWAIKKESAQKLWG